MSVQIFIDDDQGFGQWRDAHGNGYIVNAHPRPKASYLMLHRADCWHLSSPDELSWTDKYIKICSNDVGELIRWAEESVPAYRSLTACRTCDP